MEDKELSEIDIKNIVTNLIYKNNKSKIVINKIIYLTDLTSLDETEESYTVIGAKRLQFLLNLEKRLYVIRDIALKALNILKHK